MPDSATAATSVPAWPDEFAGILRDALKRSPGASQQHFVGRSNLGAEARAVAEEALAIIVGMEERIDTARKDADDAETRLIHLRNRIQDAIEAAGKDPDEDPIIEALDDALGDLASAIEEL